MEHFLHTFQIKWHQIIYNNSPNEHNDTLNIFIICLDSRLLFVNSFIHNIQSDLINDFQDNNLNIYIMQAYDKKNIKKDFPTLSFSLTDNAFACTISHLLLLNYITKNNINNCLIFEDDVHFKENYNINDILYIINYNKLYNINCDIFYFGFCFEQYPEYFRTLINKQNFKEIIIWTLLTPRCTHSYFIKDNKTIHKIFNLILKYDELYSMPIDEILCRLIFYKKLISLGTDICRQDWQKNNNNIFYDSLMNT